ARTYASFASSIFRGGWHVVDQSGGAEMDRAHHARRSPDRAGERRKGLWIADRHVFDAKPLAFKLEAAGAGRCIAAFAVGQSRGRLAQDLVEDRSRLPLGRGEVAIA